MFPTNSFLRHLDAAALEELLGQSHRKTYKKGEHIVRFNDTDNNVYVIESGRARVTLFSSEGKEVSFVDLDSGDNFGELSVIDNKPRSANVIALGSTAILIIPPQVFMDLVTSHPGVCREILQQLTAVIRRLGDRIFEYSTLDVSRRIKLELLRLAREHTDYDGVARFPKPPQADLASRLTCNREAISREYAILEKAGVLSRKRGKLIVEDIGALESMVAEHTPG